MLLGKHLKDATYSTPCLRALELTMNWFQNQFPNWLGDGMNPVHIMTPLVWSESMHACGFIVEARCV